MASTRFPTESGTSQNKGRGLVKGRDGSYKAWYCLICIDLGFYLDLGLQYNVWTTPRRIGWERRPLF
jgi:hypothetical protein